MATPPASDQAKVEAFAGKVLGDTSGTLVTVLAAIGDRLGLFKDLAANGPATSAELATRTAIDERYAREWLGAMTSAGYLSYDPAGTRFTLPPEHIPVLAEESGPLFFGGAHQTVMGMIGPYSQVVHAFQHGGGVPQSAYDENLWDGMERFTGGWHEHLLLPVWVPSMPEVRAGLERGCRVADVGCGRGRAVIKLAQAFPNSLYVGYDAFGPTIERATANARAAGVGDRVRFEHRDVAEGLPDTFDVITTFDVVHDAVHPRGLLSAIRRGLRSEGRYVCLEINSSARLEENVGPLGAFFYSVSVLYCMTTSLAHDGEGLGTCGLHEGKMRDLCAEAGFGGVRRVPLETPFHILYEVTP